MRDALDVHPRRLVVSTSKTARQSPTRRRSPGCPTSAHVSAPRKRVDAECGVQSLSEPGVVFDQFVQGRPCGVCPDECAGRPWCHARSSRAAIRAPSSSVTDHVSPRNLLACSRDHRLFVGRQRLVVVGIVGWAARTYCFQVARHRGQGPRAGRGSGRTARCGWSWCLPRCVQDERLAEPDPHPSHSARPKASSARRVAECPPQPLQPGVPRVAGLMAGRRD